MTLTPEKLNLQSTPLSEDKQTALKALVPEAFVTGELDINTLLAALGMADDDNDNTPPKKEAYGLNWAGKAQARQQARKGTNWTLAPAPEDSVNFETTQNLLIEADNLVALKLLKKGYTGKIDLIYIDPPYNVDADTVYKDDYTESVKAYEQRSGKRDDAGNLLDTFKDKGHKHSQWLNMMYPRLQLLKQLLKQGGVIFVSIDDAEVANLRLLMDEIFGEDNFVACLPTIMNLKGNNDEFGFAGTHEHTFVYSSSKNDCIINNFVINDETITDWEEDEFGYFKKGANLKGTGENAPRAKRPNLFFPVFINNDNVAYVTETNSPLNPKDIILYPITDNKEMTWRWEKKKFKNEPYNVIISTSLNDKGVVSLYKKQRPMLGDLPSKKPKTLFYRPEYSSGNGTNQVFSLFGTKLFSNPKPLDLIQDLIFLGSPADAIILDCFSGSGTTGHATMKLNAEDGGNRQYICVQLPEKLDPKNKNQATACEFLDSIAKPRTIAEITKERLRRAGAKIRQEHPNYSGDLGFKVFQQVPSQQLLATQTLDLTATTEADLEALKEAQFLQQQLSIPLHAVNPLHLAYEVMLKRHPYPLVAPIERITFAGHEECFRLGSAEGALCIFAKEININAIIKGLIELLEIDDSAFPSTIYMLENAFHSAGEYNDYANALEQLSTHYNIGTGKAERGEQPTLKFYTL